MFQCTDAFVTLATVKLETLVDFYVKLLDKKPDRYIPNVYAEFQFTGMRLVIFKPKQTNIDEFNQSGKSNMSLCLEVKDLASAIDRLKSIGYPPPGQVIIADHGKEIYAYDPLGNRLIIHQSNTEEF